MHTKTVVDVSTGEGILEIVLLGGRGANDLSGWRVFAQGIGGRWKLCTSFLCF